MAKQDKELKKLIEELYSQNKPKEKVLGIPKDSIGLVVLAVAFVLWSVGTEAIGFFNNNEFKGKNDVEQLLLVTEIRGEMKILSSNVANLNKKIEDQEQAERDFQKDRWTNKDENTRQDLEERRHDNLEKKNQNQDELILEQKDEIQQIKIDIIELKGKK